MELLKNKMWTFLRHSKDHIRKLCTVLHKSFMAIGSCSLKQQIALL